MKIAYPVLIGEGEALAMARALGNPSGALPYTVIIAPDGTVLMRHLGRRRLHPVVHLRLRRARNPATGARA